MRIRLPFLGAFFSLLLLAGYAGLSTLQLPHINDKLLHFLTFFLLTLVFYWILDTTRRRNLNLTLLICTGVLGVGSEFLQGAIPDNGRIFDVFDIVANIAGSLAAVAGCAWYHKRMLERKRAKRGYGLVGQRDETEDDVELGEGGLGRQESGIIHDDDDGLVPDHVAPPLTPTGSNADIGKTLEQEVDGWDENEIDDWDDDEAVATSGDGGKTPSASSAGDGDLGDIGKVERVPAKKLAVD